MKRIITIITLIAAAMGATAQDAEYMLIRRNYTLNSDGSMDIRYRKEIKLLRNRAITAYADKGETFILYNPATDRLTINESYTIRKDGSKVQTPQNAFIDQLPSSCENCGRYNGLRERVVVHTGLEYDCIVVLDYTIHREPSIYNNGYEEKLQSVYLEEQLQMEQDCPVKVYDITLEAPKGQLTVEKGQLDSKKSKISIDNTTESGNRVKRHIVYRNLPQSYNDVYLPRSERIYNTLHFTMGVKRTQYETLDKLPESENLIGELYREDPMEYALAIRDYVVDYIRTNDIPMSLIGYHTSSPRETFASGCGTISDKAALLAALLRQAGFEATMAGDGADVQIANKTFSGESPVAMTYHISAARKNHLRPEGAAMEEQRTINEEETLWWQGAPIGGGYKQMTLPAVKGEIAVNPAKLTSGRTAPVQVRACNERYHYKLGLPRTPKHTLVRPVNIRRKMEGVGSIVIIIQQMGDGSIDIVRELSIDAPHGIIEGKKAYRFFRQMMIDWESHKTITIKAAPGKKME